MDPAIEHHLEKVLHHLYINPLEKCNLRCAICYTRKTSPILSQEQILHFVDRYKVHYAVETITFCGGEVFSLPYFPQVVNMLTQQGIFVQIITNGTLDRLKEFENTNFVNLIVSLDGLESYHDLNRGEGNFSKSTHFLKKAFTLGFHGEIFSIVTKQNNIHIDEFEQYLEQFFGQQLSVTYHPRKPPEYLLHHPEQNIVGEIKGFDFLSMQEMMTLLKKRKTFPPKDLGCYQIAVTSDGRVFGCCEGTIPIGNMNDSIPHLVKNMRQKLEQWEKVNTLKGCLGCTSPDFVCGMKPYLSHV